MKRLCVFCGSRTGTAPVYTEETRRLGAAMVKRGLGLVFGAGHIGLMGVLADAVRQLGGETIGVIPQSLVDRELADKQLTEMRIVERDVEKMLERIEAAVLAAKRSEARDDGAPRSASRRG